MAIFVKDPDAVIDYAVDWSAGYLAGEQITDSVWSVAPVAAGGVAVMTSRTDGSKAIATLSGGHVGLVYRVTNRVVFSDGRNDERALVVRVEER